MRTRHLPVISVGILIIGIGISGAMVMSTRPHPEITHAQDTLHDIATLGPDEYIVAKTIDGDTIDATDAHGATYRVRMLGINTPETKDPRRGVECFGDKASEFTHTTLSAAVVRLERDPSQDDTDKYGRSLRFVWVNDMLFNKEIVLQGYAYEYTYDRPSKYQKELKDAQFDAQTHARGLWAPDACLHTPQAQRNTITASPDIDPAMSIIKKSKSGLCHDSASPFYTRTKNFVPYPTMEACITSGGKKYKTD